MQWRFSDKQIKKIKLDFKKDFRISQIHDALHEFEEKNNQLDMALKNAEATERLMTKRLREIQNSDLEGKTSLLTSVVSNGEVIQSANSIKIVIRSLRPIIENESLLPGTYKTVMTDISNVLFIVMDHGFKGDSDFNSALSRLIELVMDYYKNNIDSINLETAANITESKNFIDEKYKEYKLNSLGADAN